VIICAGTFREEIVAFMAPFDLKLLEDKQQFKHITKLDEINPKEPE
jgi:hypothetical protein